MTGLVEEVQRNALDPAVPVSTILRRVKVAATKLNLGDVEKWVQLELDGYAALEVPNYRVLYGRPEAFNPYNGWIPILIGVDEIDAIISRCEIREAIASLETTVAKTEHPTLRFPIPPGLIAELNEHAGVNFGRMAVALSVSQAQGLLDAVRNLVLDWALALEKRGIVGEGLSFNAEERSKAQSGSTTITIGSIGQLAGNIGHGNSAGDISLNSGQIGDLQNLVEQVDRHRGELAGAGGDPQLLATAIDGLRGELANGRPDQSKLRSFAGDLRTALSGATGNLVATGVLAALQAYGFV